MGHSLNGCQAIPTGIRPHSNEGACSRCLTILDDRSNNDDMKRDTRERILQVARELVLVQGFNHTGIGQIVKESGVPKGSFYHYFESKDELGYELLNAYCAEVFEVMDHCLSQPGQPALQLLRGYFDGAVRYFAEDFNRCNCMLGNMGMELSGQHEGFRTLLQRHFQAVETRLATCFKAAIDRGELPADSQPERLAGLLFAGWEGSLLRARIDRSPEPLRCFIEHFFSTLPETLPQPG